MLFYFHCKLYKRNIFKYYVNIALDILLKNIRIVFHLNNF